jgi:hypothetical protein
MIVFYSPTLGATTVHNEGRKFIDTKQVVLDHLTSLKQNKEKEKIKTMNILFVTAVYLAANQLIKKGNPFSIFNVTKSIRDDVNNGSLVIDDKEKVMLGGKQVSDVQHDDVKRAFIEMYDNGAFPGLGNRMSADYMYREFVPSCLSSPINSTVSNTPVSAPQPVTPQPVVKICLAPQRVFSKVQTKVQAYISSKGQPTMKQIQSRFKKAKFTCLQLADILGKAGYKITKTHPEYPSFWTVQLKTN